MTDIDLSNWKESAKDVTERSLWVSRGVEFDKYFIEDEEKFKNLECKKLVKEHHGIFVPHIPYQMIRRYVKSGETVWDPFAGIGTTLDVCNLLNVKCISSDLIIKRNEIKYGDARTFNPETNVQMIIAHPPYSNIVPYNAGDLDLSKFAYKEFLEEWKVVVENLNKYLDKDRMFILVCGDIYTDSQFIPLGSYCAEIVKSFGYVYKGHIIKDYGETKGGWKRRAQLERYRALKGGYWKFAGDNIFIMQKK